MYSSFEHNGHASFDNWVIPNLNVLKCFSFSSDVPAGGGFYSLQINTDTTDLMPAIDFYAPQILSPGHKKYILSYWSKSDPRYGGIYWYGTWNELKFGWSNDTVWTFHADTTDIVTNQTDTIFVRLSMPPSLSSYPFGFFRIDCVTLKEILLE
jgi:hypothetical protein